MRGRKKKPTEIKEAQGTLEKSREIVHISPEKITSPVPPPPANVAMLPEAAQVWHDTCKVLHDVRILTEADLVALAAFSIATANYWLAQKDINENGMIHEVVTARAIIRRRNPAFDILSASYVVMRDGFTRFGLSPSDRTKIPAAPELPKEGDEWELD